MPLSPLRLALVATLILAGASTRPPSPTTTPTTRPADLGADKGARRG